MSNVHIIILWTGTLFPCAPVRAGLYDMNIFEHKALINVNRLWCVNMTMCTICILLIPLPWWRVPIWWFSFSKMPGRSSRHVLYHCDARCSCPVIHSCGILRLTPPNHTDPKPLDRNTTTLSSNFHSSTQQNRTTSNCACVITFINIPTVYERLQVCLTNNMYKHLHVCQWIYFWGH